MPSGLFAGAVPGRNFPALDALLGPSNGDFYDQCVKLTSHRFLSASLGAFMQSMTDSQRVEVLLRSTEKATHYKWFLGGAPEKYSIWLHEYKSPEIFAEARTYAASIHNHRYSFVSRILSGGYVARYFRVDDQGKLQVAATRTFSAGQSYSIQAGDIHQIRKVEAQTFTLVVEGHAESSFSIVWDLQTSEARLIPDLPSKLSSTIRNLIGNAESL